MRLLILGTGSMASTHASAFSEIEGVSVTGCVDIDQSRAEAFSRDHGHPTVFSSLTEAIASRAFDAVANTTPDAFHYETTLQAIDGGLHVFCEKPLALSLAQAEEMTSAIEAAGLMNGVNLTYRNVAALQKAREIIADGRLGPIRHFEASYLQSWLTQPAWGDWRTEERWLWRLSEAHGSNGVLGDIGIHIFDFVSFAAGEPIAAIRADLKTFDKAPGNRIGEYRLDANDSMVMTAALSSGATGVIHATRFATGHLNDLRLRIFGLHGGLEVTNTGDLGTLKICADADRETATWKSVPLDPVPTNYQRFAEAVRTRRPMNPSFATATHLQAVIDSAMSSHARGLQVSIEEIGQK